MGFYEWNERQNRKIAAHPIRAWLITAALLGAWTWFLYTVGPDRPPTWPVVALNVLGFPTVAVGLSVMRQRRQEREPADRS